MKDDNILIRVFTKHLTYDDCEKILTKKVSRVANKYLILGVININQYHIIVKRATKKLAKGYQLDPKTIKIVSLRLIFHALSGKYPFNLI